MRCVELKFEYGDLYRFLVSAAIVLTAIAFIIPWLFLREPLDILYTQPEFEAFTSESQEILLQKQRLLLLAILAVPYASGVLILSGATAGIWGIFRWARQQKIEDKKSEILLRHEEVKLETMTAEDVSEKKENEAFEEFEGPTDKKSIVSYSDEYEKIEAKVYDRVSSLTSSSHEVLMAQKVGRNFIDILMKGKPAGRNTRVAFKDNIIDVKLRRRTIGYSDLKSAYLQIRDAATEYMIASNRAPRTTLLFVVNDANWDFEKFQVLKERIYSEFQRTGKHTIVAMTHSEVTQLSDKNFKERLGIESTLT